MFVANLTIKSKINEKNVSFQLSVIFFLGHVKTFLVANPKDFIFIEKCTNSVGKVGNKS